MNLSENNFSFPFPPYEIQKEFMQNLFETLEEKKLGIFESPTGTGKSLSIICGALTWLEHHFASYKNSLENIISEPIVEADNDDWIASGAKRIEKENAKRKAKKDLDQVNKVESKFNALRRNYSQKPFFTKKKLTESFPAIDENIKEEPDEMNDYILDEYFSDEELTEDDISSDDDINLTKIYYCSRTHSQLSQFAQEIRKTRFKNQIRVAFLGSRLNLCLNEDVLKLSSLSLMNERCLELKGSKKATADYGLEPTAKKSKTTSCPFAKVGAIEALKNQLLLEVQDLEQLSISGKSAKGCPYYATRQSVQEAQVIAMPYNCLLHKPTRDACNIRLKNSVVIVDEAHNLLETLSSVNSAVLYHKQISCTCRQLKQYLLKFERRLSAKNLLYIKQIMFLLNACLRLLDGKPCSIALKPQGTQNATCQSKTRMLSVHEFLCETSTDNFSFHKIIKYIEKSKLAFKIKKYGKFSQGEVKTACTDDSKMQSSTASFLARLQNPQNQTDCIENAIGREEKNVQGSSPSAEISSDCIEPENDNAGLLFLLEFLKLTICGYNDGRILIQNDQKRGSSASFVKYLLLNPASQFYDIVNECRSVVVAGGTMSPRNEFRNQLFLNAGAEVSRIHEFGCGHVVSSDNVLPLVLKKGPTGIDMDFTYKNRSQAHMLDELGRCILNICSVVPNGVVCFLPSYDYENFVFEHFQRTGVLAKISARKNVFREPKQSSRMDRVLRLYSEGAITNTIIRTKPTSWEEQASDASKCNGAILFCVVGGKMSEGINFSDELGRCVIMVGLPFPNSTSLELREKMNYLDSHFSSGEGEKSAGQSYYQNLCYKAVNQSIGRSIRHRNDFASIVLLDQRYSQESSRSNLPAWIESQVHVCDRFGQAMLQLRNFFKVKSLQSEKNLSE